MKKLILFLLILFSISHSFAQEEKLSEKEKARREKNIQAGNPFKRFGYKPKIATLSKGKYLEFHDLDSIVRIGSFTYNVKRKKLIGYTKLDTVHPESTLRPEIISRWFSPDPLSEEFPSWSPYNFVKNNPVRFVDPDGRAAEDVIIQCCGADYRFNQWMRAKGGIRKEAVEHTNAMIAEVDKQILRYATPLEDIYGAISGEDFDGNAYNRTSASGWALASFIPFAKIGKLGKLAKVTLKNGDEVLEISHKASKAFQEAAKGGKHSGFLKNYIGVGKESLEQGVKKFDKQISIHKNLISNPEKYLKKYKGDNWNKLDPRHQKHLIETKWPSDIKRLKEQRNILIDLSNQ